jgi:hypothetical protein
MCGSSRNALPDVPTVRLANAAPLRDLPILVAQLSNGGTVLVRAGERPYRVEDPIVLGDRPTDAAVTIRGFDPLGGGARPVLMGTRAEPYSPATAGTGAPIFAPIPSHAEATEATHRYGPARLRRSSSRIRDSAAAMRTRSSSISSRRPLEWRRERSSVVRPAATSFICPRPRP